MLLRLFRATAIFGRRKRKSLKTTGGFDVGQAVDKSFYFLPQVRQTMQQAFAGKEFIIIHRTCRLQHRADIILNRADRKNVAAGFR
ncbi:Hypothetical protein GbCGDNIH9_8664 [Granulibacter bethesdensis]|uniref:Uncharacterized protein n=1 Tax=Granulibacter bethesdensis TaxID=364410 RepID=A0AAC9KAV1_9PROT|nr:Hypothetical protein GbCGDNIH9_8664 [Granulibacter bethesdensis]APH62751.1 Hypothetical protein GbCGDNIH8_8664 [Granulibacter bethesdensis]